MLLVWALKLQEIDEWHVGAVLQFVRVSSCNLLVVNAPWFLMQGVAVLIAFLVSAIFHEVWCHPILPFLMHSDSWNLRTLYFELSFSLDNYEFCLANSCVLRSLATYSSFGHSLVLCFRYGISTCCKICFWRDVTPLFKDNSIFVFWRLNVHFFLLCFTNSSF